MTKANGQTDLEQILTTINQSTDDKQLKKNLEQRGRACCSKAMIAKVKAAAKGAKDTNEFLNRLTRTIRYLKRQGNKVYMVYPKCYCQHLRDYPGKVPAAYCACSVGFIKELFEQALGKPVGAKLISSIRRGDPHCRIQVML
jgi:predicted hydrocarbon binding protein